MIDILPFEQFIRTLDLTKLDAVPERKTYELALSINMWKMCRKYGNELAQWTDDELEKALTQNNFIGIKKGINCYVEKSLSQIDLLDVANDLHEERIKILNWLEQNPKK